ncbi:wax ester/triacylglycerol synthase domain-containing protein [Actinomycetes bacterium KLBMP 9797]
MNADAPTAVERISPDDLTQLACDVGPAPMQIAAILILDNASTLEPSAVRAAIADRIRRVPRLRQRLVRTPPGCGRPIWVDDPRFGIRHHVHWVPCPAPGDEQALLAVAATIATKRLPADRPLWSATLVTDLAHGKAGLVVVLHHVVADGIAGLAVLSSLLDGGSGAPNPGFPRPAPTWRQLLADTTSGRLRGLTALRSPARRLRHAAAELQPARTGPAPASSLNQQTGPNRRLAIASTELAAARDVAHAYGGTVNDVLLTAVTGALHALLRHRSEHVERLVVSIPASARRTAGGTGNQVGVIPVELPTGGDALQRLQAIARITQARKSAPRGASTALLGPAFRTLARMGLFHWFINHQRLVNTFVTNLRGPEHRLSFLGAPITGLNAVTVVPGNVTVTFAALSYAGTLTVTVVADPDRCPDLPVLSRHLQDELDTLASGRASLSRPRDRGRP